MTSMTPPDVAGGPDGLAEARLEAAVEELYGLSGEGFLPRRAELAAQAKASGAGELARAITALRKPTVAGWAVNALTRQRPEDLDRLTELAGRLRRAQERLDGPALLELGKERTLLVDDLVAATAQVAQAAGVRVTPAMANALAATFVAALASPEASAAVTSGRLTRALEYAGFGEIDLTEATARPLRLVRGDERATGADADVAAAERDLHEAMAVATAAAARHGVLAAELDLAETRIAQLQQEVARARAHRDRTADALADADTAQAAAQRAVRQARAAVEALRD